MTEAVALVELNREQLRYILDLVNENHIALIENDDRVGTFDSQIDMAATVADLIGRSLGDMEDAE